MNHDKKRLQSAFIRCPKYKLNGTGRDLYISAYKTPKNMLYKNRIIQNKRFMSPRIESKFKRLVSDGTGRDQYITYNNGGCIKSHKKEHHLKNFI